MTQRDSEATRARLLEAARKAFSDTGYERTTVRQIAAEAGVNPALINRYFGGKEQLFSEAVAIDLQLPSLDHVPHDQVGRVLIAHFFQRWEGDPTDDQLRVLIRTAATNGEAAARIRAVLAEQVTARVIAVAGPDRAAERAALIATQILGLAYARYVMELPEELLPRGTMRVMIGATIQRYLFDDLPVQPG